jgi:hypothetical protein
VRRLSDAVRLVDRPRSPRQLVEHTVARQLATTCRRASNSRYRRDAEQPALVVGQGLEPPADGRAAPPAA